MCLVFTHMPGQSYCRQLRSLLSLHLCCVFQTWINSLVWLFCRFVPFRTRHQARVPPVRPRRRPWPPPTRLSSSPPFSTWTGVPPGTSATWCTPWCTTSPSPPAATTSCGKATAQGKSCRRKGGRLLRICARCAKRWTWRGRRNSWPIQWGRSGSVQFARDAKSFASVDLAFIAFPTYRCFFQPVSTCLRTGKHMPRQTILL